MIRAKYAKTHTDCNVLRPTWAPLAQASPWADCPARYEKAGADLYIDPGYDPRVRPPSVLKRQIHLQAIVVEFLRPEIAANLVEEVGHL